jgi:hypothetical protein
MAPRRCTQSIDRAALKFTSLQRTLILTELEFLDRRLLTAVRRALPGQSVRVTLQQLDDLAQYVAAELLLSKDGKLRRSLGRLYTKLVGVRERRGGSSRPHRLAPSLVGAPLEARDRPKKVAVVSVHAGHECFRRGVRLTQWERESLIRATRLGPAMKQRLAEVPGGTQFLHFGCRQMAQMRRMVEKAVPLAFSPHKRRLQEVLAKLAGDLG